MENLEAIISENNRLKKENEMLRKDNEKLQAQLSQQTSSVVQS